MKAETSDGDRAHAVYTPRSLALYDRWVLGFSNKRIWKCDTQKIEGLYRDHLSADHLEVGVGTGYFLEKALPPQGARITLFDINPHCLDRASGRIAGHHPETRHGSILEPLNLPGERFDSVGINYLLHSLPGTLDQKAGLVFDHLLPVLNRNGVVFGSTILGMDIERPFAAKLMMGLYNWRGIFSNRHDSLGGIMEALSRHFRTFNVEVCGCVVLFWGRGRRNDSSLAVGAGDQ